MAEATQSTQSSQAQAARPTQEYKKVYLYTRFERFWHWTQALLIIMLMITGFEIHGTYRLIGFNSATNIHNVAAIALITLAVFAAFWHFATGEWRQFLPTRHNLGAMVYFYLIGIFRGEQHPTRTTRAAKLNPLQRLAYLSFKLLIFPVLATTGLLYLFYNSWSALGIAETASVAPVALLHTAGAFLLVGFMILHIYMTTTGITVLENIKSMITGRKRIRAQEERAGERGKRIVAE